eukprot:TRINITY_DN28050_c0_g6_i1.p1 TRINITY_DN28050_c0_g6~~TRINITY_DN28050_c0_g6_i1.p1  ORF type:complete len:1888 (+),score=485.27 TRINITY_DN28050_c0_g6_i1:132-5795(+)
MRGTKRAYTAILAVVLGVLFATDVKEYPRLHGLAQGVLGVGFVLFVNWLFGLWAFKLCRASAPRRESRLGGSAADGDSGAAPRVSLDWSTPADFPEGFSPLLSLRELAINANSVSGALIGEVRSHGTLVLRPGRHPLRVSSRGALKLEVPAGSERQRRCSLVVRAGQPAADCEAAVYKVCLELPWPTVTNISNALDALWELWGGARSDSSFAGTLARRAAVFLLNAIEHLLPIRLVAVEATGVGEQLWIFFSGAIGPFPFERIHLPTFILPRLHAPLSRLLSTQPVVGKRLRHGSDAPPMLHPALLESWHLSLQTTFSPVGLDILLRQDDGSRTTIAATLLDEGVLLNATCDVSGSLGDTHLSTDLTQFTLSKAGNPKRGLRGSGSMSLAIPPATARTSQPSARLPDLLYGAACNKRLTRAVELSTSLKLDQGSEVPEGVRLVIGDEHPLLLGQLTAAMILEKAALVGEFGLSVVLPLEYKRDLLVVPTMDLQYEAAVSLDDEAIADDGFVTLRVNTARGNARGRLWSSGNDSVQAELDVEGGARVAVDVRDSSIVKALEEAEAFASQLAATVRGRIGSDWRTERVGTSSHHHCCVKAGDVIRIEGGGNATGQLKMHLSTKRDLISGLSLGDNEWSPVLGRSQKPQSLLSLRHRVTSFDEASSQRTDRSFLLSLDGSKATLELRDSLARVGDLAVTLPKLVKARVDFLESFISGEGVGRTALHAMLEEVQGQIRLENIQRSITAVLPALPRSGGASIGIGSMGQVTVTPDEEMDAVKFGNRLLDEEAMYTPLLEAAALFSLRSSVGRLLNFARVVRNVVRTEHVEEPKDIVPAERLARFCARCLMEIGTDGSHVADPDQPSELEEELLQLVMQAVDAKGLDVTKVTRLLWDYLPAEACSFVQDYTAEVDFVAKYLDALLRPTESAPGPDLSLAYEPPPPHNYRYELEEVAPPASRLYESLGRGGDLPKNFEESLLRVAPYLTTKQVEHALLCNDLGEEIRRKLTFILGLKQRAEKVGKGYGGPAFMPQGMVVGFFLATAIRGSLVGDGGTNAGLKKSAIGHLKADQGTLEEASNVGVGGRLAALLREQQAVAAEMSRLQEYQAALIEEAAQLAGVQSGTARKRDGSVLGTRRPSMLGDKPTNALEEDEETPEEEARSMLDLIVPGVASEPCRHARAAINASADLAAFQEAQVARLESVQRRYSRRSSSEGVERTVPSLPPVQSLVRQTSPRSSRSKGATTFDLGCSLLGPREVAVLLQSGLAAVPQGRQVQQNQRMLLEIIVSQPPLFLKGVLYELSSNGSSRMLANHLMALLDFSQDTIRPHARVDVADLLTTALGVQMPRRADFMAGGSRASNSYVLFILKAAKQVLEECEPYVALRHWLQRADAPTPGPKTEPGPAKQRAVEEAAHAVEEADRLGATWLEMRGAAGPAMKPSDQLSMLRKGAMEAYRQAFRSCAAALKGYPELFEAEWFKAFWVRNYDALMVVSVLRNAQQDVDEVRKWIDAQLRHASTDETCPKKASEDMWAVDLRSEAFLVDCLIEILFYRAADRERYRKDPLAQLVVDEPAGHFDFTVVSAMGVITEGACGTEMAAVYGRLKERRGVEVIRADTATLQSVDYNAAQIEKAVKDHVRTPWGWVGYSQGCANAFRAEALMLQGTPEQKALMDGFRCRQLLFSAANGSAHASCAEWKLLHAFVDGERFIKRFQASMSKTTQLLALKLLGNFLTSRASFAVFGSMQSLTHEGARQMWRDGRHCHTAPTCSMRAATEPHTQPECLLMLSNVLLQQMDYATEHDTQVALEEAVASPWGVKNVNAEQLAKMDLRSAIQRTHHWSPLNAEVTFLTTEQDKERAMFSTPKDRHVFPWLEVNARFGIIKRKGGTESAPSSP